MKLENFNFRIWDIELQSYQYNYESLNVFDTDSVIEFAIGKQDINKRDIYVGDIVKLPHSDELGEITFENFSFCLTNLNANDNIQTLADFYRQNENYQLEVIGNIHENTDLLAFKNRRRNNR